MIYLYREKTVGGSVARQNIYNYLDRRNNMAQKNKVTFEVRIDETLYRKLLGVAEREKCNLNNHMLKLIRTNVEYSERIHGKIDPAKYPIPEDAKTEE